MKQPFFDKDAKLSFAGGMLTSVFATIHYTDLLETALLAAVGAASSFGITFLMKIIIKKVKRKQ
jgi:hypothetical protein